MENIVVPCAKPVGQEKNDGVLVQWAEHILGHVSDIRTSLPFVTLEDKIGVQAILESQVRTAKEVVNTEFEISDYICHECLLNGKVEGEKIPAIRTVLLGPGIAPIAFVAVTALEFVVRTARGVPGKPAWDPPLYIRLRMETTEPPKFVYKFQILDRAKKK